MPNGTVVPDTPVEPGESIRTCVDDLTNEPALYWYNTTTELGGPGWLNDLRCDDRDAAVFGQLCKQRSCDNHDAHCPGRFVSCMPSGCLPDDVTGWQTCGTQDDGGEGCPANQTRDCLSSE